MKTCRLVKCIALFAGLAGCVQVPQGTETFGIKPFKVQLEVTKDAAGKDVLDVKNDRTPGCDKFPDEDKFRKGCIVADLNKIVEVEFKLSGTSGWYFSAFQVCSEGKSQKPDTFPVCSLTGAQRANWLVLAKSGMGVLDKDGRFDIITEFGTGLTQFKVLDLNLMEGKFFYGVQACTGTGAYKRCLWTDPGGENKGRR